MRFRRGASSDGLTIGVVTSRVVTIDLQNHIRSAPQLGWNPRTSVPNVSADWKHLTSFPDSIIAQIDLALRVLMPNRPTPSVTSAPQEDAGFRADPAACAHAAALMRVNHVGEVCAQALYHGQALTARMPAIRHHMEQAAAEEGEHLKLCAQRIDELGGRVSLLNPLWYAGAFALGAAAGRAGDAVSLGFVAETEKQVEAHLESHLAGAGGGLPPQDLRSRDIVATMREDEARHRRDATAAGGEELPFPVRLAMKGMAKVMTTVAYRL